MINDHELTQLEAVFRKVFRKMSSLWGRTVEEDISSSQAIILELLEKEGPRKSTDLAEALEISLAAVTSLSDKLVSAGFAERIRTEADRRVVYLDITGKGQQMMQLIRKKRSFCLNKMFYGLSGDDIQHLIRIYKQVLTNLESTDSDVRKQQGR